MKMLTGNLAPSAGIVKIKGVSLREQPKLAKSHIGYLPEQPPVYPELTVDEYLRFCAGLHGVRSEEHTSELQSLMRISYAVFCLKKKKYNTIYHKTNR